MSTVKYIYINGTISEEDMRIVVSAVKALYPGAQVANCQALGTSGTATDLNSAEYYKDEKPAARKDVLDAMATLEYSKDLTWIFIDECYAGTDGEAAAREIQAAARARGVPFVPIFLEYDVEIVELREEEVFGFGVDEGELKMDVTGLMGEDVAMVIYEYANAFEKKDQVETPADEEEEEPESQVVALL